MCSCWGILGTGGTSWACGAATRAGEGEGDRKVRSVIELALGDRCSSRLLLSRLPVDETEALLRATLFDCTCDTLVGVVGRAFRAAAAAADDRDGVDSRLRKAEAAAVAALGLAVSRVNG